MNYPIYYQLGFEGTTPTPLCIDKINQAVSEAETILKDIELNEIWIYETKPILRLVRVGKEISQLPISPLVRGKR